MQYSIQFAQYVEGFENPASESEKHMWVSSECFKES